MPQSQSGIEDEKPIEKGISEILLLERGIACTYYKGLGD